MRDLVKECITDKGYTLFEPISLDSSNKNTLFKVICKNNKQHVFTTSITYLTTGNPISLDNGCPHCVKEKKDEEQGLPLLTVQTWSNSNKLSFSPVKAFYNRWSDDSIEFTCNKCSDRFTIKSLGHFEKVTILKAHKCEKCQRIEKGILTIDQFKERIDDIKAEVGVEEQKPDLLKEVDVSSLTPKLKERYVNQKNWRMVSFTNTKQKCTYQCLCCHNTKTVLGPFSLFVGNEFGCKHCQSIKVKSLVVDKIKNVCNQSQIYPINDFEYKECLAPIDFKCNQCGENFSKTWKNIVSDSYRVNCPHCKNGVPYVTEQQEVENFIKSLVPNEEVLVNDRKLINPLELDIVIPSKKIAIEYCGLYWHSENKGKDETYHKNKLDRCVAVGYRLITIFDGEWKDKREICESRLRHLVGASSNKLMARKCQIRQIDNKEALSFCQNNHIQGRGTANTSYGLFYSNQLVSVMTFSKPSAAKGRADYDWELNRFCSLLNYSIPGAASKLLIQFKKEHVGSKLVSFCDLRWGDGTTYSNIGMLHEYNSRPNYYYYGKLTDWKMKHRFNYTKTKLLKILKESDSSEYTEYELAQLVGLHRAYDCGHMKFSMVL